MTKQQARAEAKARWRRYSPEALAALGRAMAEALFALPQWQQAATVFCFVPLASEPDVTPVLRRALAEGKRLAVPRVLPGGGMEAVVIRELSALRPQ
ncbi:MAG: 5-formyltetrahydrofolate cyclo-ligase, partial [Gemmiger sp.]